jgi:predicted nuclease of predicted toxin-antitoxin system
MRWLADECISAPLVEALRGAGHDVIYATEVFQSAKDRALLTYAMRERRLLLTEDKDFGELVFGPQTLASTGVVLMRIADELSHLAWPRLQAAIERFGESLFGHFVVVEDTRFRVRALEP